MCVCVRVCTCMISRDVMYWPVMNISRDVRSAEANPGAPCCFTPFHMSMYWLCVYVCVFACLACLPVCLVADVLVLLACLLCFILHTVSVISFQSLINTLGPKKGQVSGPRQACGGANRGPPLPRHLAEGGGTGPKIAAISSGFLIKLQRLTIRLEIFHSPVTI
jgi:hypothetical protein